MKRIRLATAWLSGCSGCHMSLLNLHGDLLELFELYELVYSPFTDIKEFPRNVDIALIEGAVSSQDNLEMARIIRERTLIVASLGDCALNGNVTALRNPKGKTTVIDAAYTQHNNQPGGFGSDVSTLLNSALPLHHVILVNAFISGCPPEPDQIRSALKQLAVRL
ncbi:MAG: hypothetical protein WC156_07815 [Pedobacter sp.]